MIGVLLLSASLLLVLLLVVMVLVVWMKQWATKKDEESKQRFKELKESIDDTQRLFRVQVSDILKKLSNLLSEKNENL